MTMLDAAAERARLWIAPGPRLVWEDLEAERLAGPLAVLSGLLPLRVIEGPARGALVMEPAGGLVNPDPANPSHRALLIRATNPWWVGALADALLHCRETP